MSEILKKLKEDKKTMQFSIDAATKMAGEAAEKFINAMESLAESASEEDLKEIMNLDDKEIDMMDKLVFIQAYAETHDDVDDIAVAVIGVHR